MNDGGSAFPMTGTRTSPITGIARTESSGGMTLRDYFAAEALNAVPMPQPELHDIQAAYDRIAQHAYKMADAMLKARATGETA
jgi:hypothetical protein